MKTTKKYTKAFSRIHFQKDESINNLTLKGATSLADVQRDDTDYNNVIINLKKDGTKVDKSEYNSKINEIEGKIGAAINHKKYVSYDNIDITGLKYFIIQIKVSNSGTNYDAISEIIKVNNNYKIIKFVGSNFFEIVIDGNKLRLSNNSNLTILSLDLFYKDFDVNSIEV